MGDFSTPFSPRDKLSSQKSKREILKTIDVINQMDLKGIYRTFHSNTKEYSLYCAPNGMFSKIDYILRHKSSLIRDKEIGITPHIL